MVQIWRSIESVVGLLALAVVLLGVAAAVGGALRAGRGADVRTAYRIAGLDAVLGANLLGFAYVTLWPSGLGSPPGRPSLIPFADTADTVGQWLGFWFPEYGWSYIPPGIIAVLGNAMMLAPFAALLRFRWPALARFGATVGTTALVALVPEVCQLLLPFGRAASVDDVILPTLGGAAAYGLCTLFLRLRRRAPAEVGV